jgi:hypothetical protein
MFQIKNFDAFSLLLSLLESDNINIIDNVLLIL